MPKPLALSRKSNSTSSSEAAFKPRKVKKAEQYRDRASERRLGERNDYAQVEAVLEEFERSTADQDKQTVDVKRRYLGGDEDHSILVKGLDMALLEQNRAKEATGRTAEEDEQLEKAFMEGGKSTTTEALVPSGRKRTREEIIRDLKNKRVGAGPIPTSQEDELAKRKFKPIGFKPIGAPVEEKAKKRKVKGEDEKKRKKKQKVAEVGPSEKEKNKTDHNDQGATVEDQTPRISSQPKQREPEPELPDDLDIFADAGDYDELGDDEERDITEKKVEPGLPPTNTKLGPGRWFADDQDQEVSDKPEPGAPSPPQPTSTSQAPNDNEDGQLEEDEDPMRLVPLQSSSLPSIKDFLAMDEAAEKANKKKQRKAKQKQKQSESQMSTEAKVNRDYQRLKSFTDSRGA